MIGVIEGSLSANETAKRCKTTHPRVCRLAQKIKRDVRAYGQDLRDAMNKPLPVATREGWEDDDIEL